MEKRASPQADAADAEFRLLFENEFAFVVRSLLRLGVRESDVDDVAVEVFLKVHARLADFDRARPVRPWLFAFAVRIASDYRRLARHRHEQAIGDEEPPGSGRTPEHRAIEAQQRALVLEALEALDDDKRTVFVLHELEDQTVPEIAHAVGVPVATAYTRLAAARDAFAASMKRVLARRRP